MLPEVDKKMDWMFPARPRTTMTPKTQKLRSSMSTFTPLSQCLAVGDRDDQPSSPHPVCSEPFCTQFKDYRVGITAFSFSEQYLKAVILYRVNCSNLFLLSFIKSSTIKPKQLLTIPPCLSVVIRNIESHSAALFHN